MKSLVTIFFAVCLVTTTSSGANLFTNGNFETADLSGWSQVNNSGHANLSGGGPYVPTGATQGTRFYGFTTHDNGRFLYQTVTVTQNTTYLLRGMVGGDEQDDDFAVWMVDGAVVPTNGAYPRPTNPPGGPEDLWIKNLRYCWYPFSVKHTTGAGVTQMTVIFRADQDDIATTPGGRVFLDDLEVDVIANLSDTPVSGTITENMNGTYALVASGGDGTYDKYWGMARGPWAGPTNQTIFNPVDGPVADPLGATGFCTRLDGDVPVSTPTQMIGSVIRDFVNVPAGTWEIRAWVRNNQLMSGNSRIIISAEVNPPTVDPYTAILDADLSQSFATITAANNFAVAGTWYQVSTATADYAEPVGPNITTAAGDTIRVWMRIVNDTAFPGNGARIDFLELINPTSVDNWSIY